MRNLFDNSLVVKTPDELFVFFSEEQNDTSDGFFNTWIIASIGIVVLSIFVSSIFITRATRRRRYRRRNVLTDQDFDDTLNQQNLSPVAEDSYGSELNMSELNGNSKLDEFRQMYGWHPGGLEVVEEESEASQSLAGLDYVGSATGSIAATSRGSGDGISTLTGPTVKDKKAVEEQQPGAGLNARMRKRLIEREVQKNGVQAGISMEAILLGTASFSDESNDGNADINDRRSISFSADTAERLVREAAKRRVALARIGVRLGGSLASVHAERLRERARVNGRSANKNDISELGSRLAARGAESLEGLEDLISSVDANLGRQE